MGGVLYLASTSPRRQELLHRAGVAFRLHPPGPEPEGEGPPRERALIRARHKARGAAVPDGPGPVLGVDTVVALGAREFGKPADRDAARSMLRHLAGAEHVVWTGHHLFDPRRGTSAEAIAEARVRCRPLRPAEIEAYLDTGDWSDKAGGYGIQGAAAAFMELVSGDLDTVIGLRVETVRALLDELGEGA